MAKPTPPVCCWYTADEPSIWYDEKESLRRILLKLVQADPKSVIWLAEIAKDAVELVCSPRKVNHVPEAGTADAGLLQKVSSKADTADAGLLQKAPRVSSKVIKRTDRMAAGEYICYRYAETTFGKVTKPVLFVRSTTTAEHEETAICGYFLQKELERVGGVEKLRAPILCTLGETQKTPKERIGRLITIKST